MQDTAQSPLTATGFVASQADVDGLMAWFAEYDALAARHDVEAMADTALLPVTVISNDSAGDGVVQQWDRDALVASFGASMESVGEVRMENDRTPVFLNADVAVVVTNSKVTAGEQVQHMRYADVMVKSGGRWRFASMIQAGWGDVMKQYA